MSLPEYEVLALRYAALLQRKASQNFLHLEGDDRPMPLDFFVWAIIGHGRRIVVDTGFGAIGAARRNRQFLCTPVDALERAGIRADEVDTVVLSHLHYDHAGNLGAFGRARFHLQDAEMAFCTGRCMCQDLFRIPMEVEDVIQAVRFVFSGRMQFHDGVGTIAPGITVHRVGGHTKGLQVVRVNTRRGWVMLASDGTHFWDNIRTRNPFPVITDAVQSLTAYEIIEGLADGPEHIIPGHDPQVLSCFPTFPGIADVVRLDADPLGS